VPVPIKRAIMIFMDEREEKRNELRIRINREELFDRIQRLLPKDGALEPFPGFLIARLSKPTESLQSIFQPALCFVVQGGKRVLLGEEIFRYDPGHYLLYTVDLPLVFQVEKACEEEPYMGFSLNLDPALVAEVLVEAGVEGKKRDATVKAIDVQAIDADLLDAVVRLFRLFDTPNQVKVLAPLITKEIVYRLLMTGQGSRLSHLMASAGDTRRISRAIEHLREHFDEPFRVEEVARKFGMSTSGFHQHFKSVTAMSPLQFQKQIRLQEARRLMLADDLDAASAGFRVGYEDPAYFSRDYKKLFGAPPQRDIARLRSTLEM
jgi:AraC-like DNA-binding protein